MNNDLQRDIDNWKCKDEIAHWKSMAVAYYYENQMLQNHLKDVYCKYFAMKKYVEESDGNRGVYKGEQQLESEGSRIGKTSNVHRRIPIENAKWEDNKSLNINNVYKNTETFENEIQEPIEVVCHNRSEELKELYGSKGPQIAGVETALQLNYEHLCSKLQPKHWPELQLNLG